MTQYKPLPIPIYWLGTKVRMRNKINAIIADVPRTLYIEPFGGACGLLFGKKPEAEVYNDKDKRLCNLFRTLQEERLAEKLLYLTEITPSSRTFYLELRTLAQAWLRGDDISRMRDELNLGAYGDNLSAAFAFFYVMNNCFHARVNENLAFGGGETGRAAGGTARRYAHKRALIMQFCERLRYVTIENLDYRTCAKAYDHETTLFYFDPPYIGKSSKVYADQPRDTEIVDLLMNLRGKWVLSCYDTPEYERLLAIADRVQYDASSTIAIKAKEKNCKRIETVYTNIRRESLLHDEGKEPLSATKAKGRTQ